MSNEVEKILKETGAVLEGHFLLTSGLHSPAYLEKFQILQYPRSAERLCEMIAKHFKGENIQAVAGPTLGGMVLAYEVARQLGVRGVYAEREGEARVFRRGSGVAPGERVLVVDDVLTTGGSIRQVIDEVVRKGGKVIGVGVLVDRSGGKVSFGLPFFRCIEMAMAAYPPEQCPLCAKGIPLVKPGGSPA